jgi:hypothetical protein
MILKDTSPFFGHIFLRKVFPCDLMLPMYSIMRPQIILRGDKQSRKCIQKSTTAAKFGNSARSMDSSIAASTFLSPVSLALFPL